VLAFNVGDGEIQKSRMTHAYSSLLTTKPLRKILVLRHNPDFAQREFGSAMASSIPPAYCLTLSLSGAIRTSARIMRVAQ